VFAIEKIKAVLFDLDGTLRHSLPNGNELFWEFAAAQGAPGDIANRREALIWAHNYWANSQELLQDQLTFSREGEDFWHNYTLRHLLALGASESLARELTPQVHAYMRANYNPVDTVPDDVLPTLETLRTNGFALGLVTNRRESINEKMESWGFNGFFDFQFAAGEIGSWKPEPEIFHYALGLAGVQPEQAIYVGDNYFADIKGAEAARLTPVLIDPQGIWEGYADCFIIHQIADLIPLLRKGVVAG
jgi:HAD superfamily hydrolase (TIGR01549 family)